MGLSILTLTNKKYIYCFPNILLHHKLILYEAEAETQSSTKQLVEEIYDNTRDMKPLITSHELAAKLGTNFNEVQDIEKRRTILKFLATPLLDTLITGLSDLLIQKRTKCVIECTKNITKLFEEFNALDLGRIEELSDIIGHTRDVDIHAQISVLYTIFTNIIQPFGHKVELKQIPSDLEEAGQLLSSLMVPVMELEKRQGQLSTAAIETDYVACVYEWVVSNTNLAFEKYSGDCLRKKHWNSDIFSFFLCSIQFK